MVEPAENPALSKTRFLAGLQCHKRLYLECFEPELATPIDTVRRFALDAGTTIGKLARERFPGGVLIDHANLDHERAVTVTRQTLAAAPPAIYEAAATADNVRIRADLLVRDPVEGVDLVEVKSTTKVRPEHEWDMAIQFYVLERADVRVRRAYLMHLNREYVYSGGEHELKQLFVLQDLTERVHALLADVERELERMRAGLQGGTPPPVAVGPHCEEPYKCSFYDHCHEGLPEDPFAALPRVTRKLRARLERAGIATLDELQLDFRGLSLLQRRALEALKSGKRVVDPAAREALAAVRFPVHFVDFEAFSPAIPLYVGTRPYEAIPFQWSDHELRENGELIHREFLHGGEGDPRREFAERLLEATEGAKSVMVYSNFEDQRLADLQRFFPDLSEPLGDLRLRLFDLLPVIRRHVYDGAFGGSFSIKAVLPALVPHMGYDDLPIAEGSLASVAFSEIVSAKISAERRSELRNNLLAYCRRDTEAMCELFRVLR